MCIGACEVAIATIELGLVLAAHYLAAAPEPEPDWGEVRALENLGVASDRAKQISIDNVKTSTKGNVQQQSHFRSKLIEAGKLDPGVQQAAHHIVEKNDKFAQEARDILSNFNVGIDSVNNGIGLSEHARRGRHTASYSDAVVARLREATDEKTARSILDEISQEQHEYDKNGRTVDDWAMDEKDKARR